jgi:FKBP-type peptidyl-prolyl cis-trans isomerase FklB
MNTKAIAVAAFTLITGACGLRAEATNNSPFKDDQERVSYSIGLNIGNNFKRQEVEVDYNLLLRGIKDANSEQKLMTEDEVRDTLTKYQQDRAAKQQEKRRLLSEKNKKEGDAFLAENKNKPGVVATPSGLQYKIVSEGSGESPKADDTVVLNFRGSLVDGTEFENTVKNGKTVSFRLGSIPVRGWGEALAQMKPGAKWDLFIPPDLAYGNFGRPPQVGPEATVVYELELVSVQTAPPRAPLTSDIIKVPSLDEMKKGAKIETIKAEDLEKLQKEEAAKAKAAEGEKK